ncbi:MAG: DNA polymerase III subunit delta [Actinomycetota bacterium]
MSSDAAPVLVLWGDSSFLLRRAAMEAFGEVHPVELDGSDWSPGSTADLATPSLFGEQRGLMITAAQALPRDGLAEMARYASAPAPGARLVLAFEVGARAKGPPRAALKALGDAVEVRRVALERRDLPEWVRGRAEARGIPATPQGIQTLIQTLGEDPGVLDQAVEQLAGSHPGDGVIPQTVTAQFRGLGDRRIWELCDAAFGGDVPTAMRALVGMLDAGEEPLVLLGGIASRLRDLIRVRSLPPRTPLAQVARQAGLRFDWQARRYRDQARRFTPDGLARLHAELVGADQALKQGGSGETVLTTVVSRIAVQEERRPAPAGRR